MMLNLKDILYIPAGSTCRRDFSAFSDIACREELEIHMMRGLDAALSSTIVVVINFTVFQCHEI